MVLLGAMFNRHCLPLPATGTLHQAIVTEVVFRTVTAYPYIVMTRAFKTANFKLVCSIALFQVGLTHTCMLKFDCCLACGMIDYVITRGSRAANMHAFKLHATHTVVPHPSCPAKQAHTHTHAASLPHATSMSLMHQSPLHGTLILASYALFPPPNADSGVSFRLLADGAHQRAAAGAGDGLLPAAGAHCPGGSSLAVAPPP